MVSLLAVISFCVAEQCAFFAAKEIANSETKCLAQLKSMSRELDKQFGADNVKFIAACVNVPFKTI